MDGAKVGIFEETDEVGLGGFLEGQDRRSLESEITLEILGDLTDQTLEGKLSDEQVGALLVATDLAEGDGSGPVTVGLLDTPGGRSGLAGGLGGELLAGSLTSGGLAGGLRRAARAFFRATKATKATNRMSTKHDARCTCEKKRRNGGEQLETKNCQLDSILHFV